MENIMAIESTTIKSSRPVFTAEQKEAWKKAKALLKTLIGKDVIRFRALHIAMSELRGKYKTHKGPIEILSKNPDKATQKQSLDTWNNLRAKVDAWKSYLEDPGSKKLFIITDGTLSDSQKAVQSSHCAAQFVKEHPLAPWTNGTLVLLTPDVTHRAFSRITSDDNVMDKFVSWYGYGYNHITVWRESDMEDKITSIAILDDFKEAGKIPGLKML